MDCTDAYREALTRDYEATASSAPAWRPTPAPGQRQGADPGAVAGRGPATAPDTGETAVNERR
jgi:hypothetical protein